VKGETLIPVPVEKWEGSPQNLITARMNSLTARCFDFLGFIWNSPEEEVEAHLQRFPHLSRARLQIIPIILARTVPTKSHVIVEKPARRISPDDLKGVPVEVLKKLAGIGEDKGQEEAAEIVSDAQESDCGSEEGQ